MEEGLFPHSRSKDDPEAMEEERRLCYVGMTRARENLYLTYADKRRVFGTQQHNIPSRYLSDIPEELLLKVNIVPSFTGTSFGGSYSGTSTPMPKAQPSGGLNFGGGELSGEVEGFPKGCKVMHPTFGEGVVRGGEGEGEKAKVSVYFPRLGLKKLVVKYAPLEKI